MCRHQLSILNDYVRLTIAFNLTLKSFSGHFQFHQCILTRASQNFTGASQNFTRASEKFTRALCPLTGLIVGIDLEDI